MRWAATGPGGVSPRLSYGREGAEGGGDRRTWWRRCPTAARERWPGSEGAALARGDSAVSD